MTTWLASSPVYHPWFIQPSAKRKLSVASSTSSSPTRSPSASPPPLKRRKSNALETDFSTLTLANPHAGSFSASPYVSESIATPSDNSAMDDDDTIPIPTVVLPSVIEDPAIPEVKMKSSSWYEPEPDRIVITDLNSSSDEEDNPDPDTTSISISEALLKQISSRSRDMTEPVLPLQRESQALVLFKPLPIWKSTVIPEEPKDDRTLVNTDDIVDVIEDDDAMDVEPY